MRERKVDNRADILIPQADRAADAGMQVREFGQRFGPDKGSSRYLYRLFPDGPARQACRYAGLPKPVSCI